MSQASFIYNHAQKLKVKFLAGHLTIKLGKTEGKTVPLAKVQLYEYENQTALASRLSARFDNPVSRQKVSILATAHIY